jgi:hypothetical protein
MQGDWETLCSEFCLYFFPIHRVVNLRKVVLIFRQLEQESLSTSWDRFTELVTSGPNLGFPDPVLIQYFYLSLTKNSTGSLDLSSGGAFPYLPISKARAMINKVALPNSELLEEEKESYPEQAEKFLVAKTQPLQSQDLAINPKPSKSHFNDLDFQLAKMLVNQCTSDLLGRASWKKCRQLPFLLKDIGRNAKMACLVMP